MSHVFLLSHSGLGGQKKGEMHLHLHVLVQIHKQKTASENNVGPKKPLTVQCDSAFSFIKDVFSVTRHDATRYSIWFHCNTVWAVGRRIYGIPTSVCVCTFSRHLYIQQCASVMDHCQSSLPSSASCEIIVCFRLRQRIPC